MERVYAAQQTLWNNMELHFLPWNRFWSGLQRHQREHRAWSHFYCVASHVEGTLCAADSGCGAALSCFVSAVSSNRLVRGAFLFDIGLSKLRLPGFNPPSPLWSANQCPYYPQMWHGMDLFKAKLFLVIMGESRPGGKLLDREIPEVAKLASWESLWNTSMGKH